MMFFQLKFILTGNFSTQLGTKTQHCLLEIEGQHKIQKNRKKAWSLSPRHGARSVCALSP